MKYFIIFSLLIVSLNAKECYKNKFLDKKICYYKYYDRNKLYKPKSDEHYYRTQNGSIYALNDQIEVRFNAVGAVLSILDDYNIEFVDKTRGETFIFRVKDPKEFFIILRKLNDLTAIQKAVPLMKRKYTKEVIQKRIAASKERQQKALEKANAAKEGTVRGVKTKGPDFKGGNFLKGGVQ